MPVALFFKPFLLIFISKPIILSTDKCTVYDLIITLEPRFNIAPGFFSAVAPPYSGCSPDKIFSFSSIFLLLLCKLSELRGLSIPVSIKQAKMFYI